MSAPVDHAGPGQRRPGILRDVFLGISLFVLAEPAMAHADRQAPKIVRSMLEMRQEKVVLQEWDLSCGAAALATILAYQHGDPVPEREIAQALIGRKEYIENPLLVRIRQGFSLLDLKRYVEGRGYEGIGYGRLTLEDLSERAPIMVPINSNGYNHFVVFLGVLEGRATMADPAFGNRTMPVDAFQRAWLDLPEIGKVGFVVARRDGEVPPNKLVPDNTGLVITPDAVLRTAIAPMAR